MTRYPKPAKGETSGKGKKWTHLELRTITKDWLGDTLADPGGLVGEVRVATDGAISVRFRYAFKRDGKKAWHYCGTWPAVGLEEIRRSRDDARIGLMKSGINPTEQRKADRIEAQREVEGTLAEAERVKAENVTVRDMFAAWMADGVQRKDGNAELQRSFDKDVLPRIGDMPVKLVTEHDLRALLRAVVTRGVHRMAVRLSLDLRQLFTWAEKRQPWRKLMAEGNPTELIEIEKIVPADYDLTNLRTRTLSPEEIRELRDIFVAMEACYEAAPNKRSTTRPLQKQSQIALWISLSTTCRIGELLMSRWEHVDFEAGTWFIPKEHVKGARGKKQDQTVYMSDFTVRQFKALHELSGHTNWCFPNRAAGKGEEPTGPVCVKSVSKQIGDRQEKFKDRKPLKNRRHDNTLVLSEGRNSEWTPHDLRRTAATMMQGLRVLPDVIDRCQNHVMAGSKVRRHYMQHEYAEEKREAWRLLGERLDIILNHANVLPLMQQTA